MSIVETMQLPISNQSHLSSIVIQNTKQLFPSSTDKTLMMLICGTLFLCYQSSNILALKTKVVVAIFVGEEEGKLSVAAG